MIVEGAEGLDLDVTLAGLGSRTGAAVLDLLIQAVLLFVVGFLGAIFGDAGVAIIAVGSFLVIFGYPVVGETFADGQTPGKRLLGLAVVRLDGSPVTFLASVVRNVVRIVDVLPGTYLVGAVAIMATGRNQRVGDLAAGTIVVHRVRAGTHLVGGYAGAFGGGATPSPGGVAPVPGSSLPPVLSPEVAGWDVAAVSVDEVAAIRSFLARRHTLDPAHRANLAQTLAFQILPKVAGVPLDGGPEHFLERIAAARTG
jgi:uncharacterized RDD family membrane protein YckC